MWIDKTVRLKKREKKKTEGEREGLVGCARGTNQMRIKWLRKNRRIYIHPPNPNLHQWMVWEGSGICTGLPSGGWGLPQRITIPSPWAAWQPCTHISLLFWIIWDFTIHATFSFIISSLSLSLTCSWRLSEDQEKLTQYCTVYPPSIYIYTHTYRLYKFSIFLVGKNKSDGWIRRGTRFAY